VWEDVPGNDEGKALRLRPRVYPGPFQTGSALPPAQRALSASVAGLCTALQPIHAHSVYAVVREIARVGEHVALQHMS
jgi:hypothetical protein